ncbi:unnamed protein product [Rhizophagus irregularis]|uniref:MIR domain-containing protein n=1 Tax=Rhizophagus irregularis TaxID=588596 RepID=A0A2N1MHU4_9GLOM|nr:hypothetical protein RhiirC2_760982 [Rhizophagus irregularis]CAB4388948.1 unnamed protein product [Rhizophagus irregularis]CAB5384817.1 unnamed protein product [Rhizophagus irregularis]
MLLQVYDGNIHPDEWLRQFNAYCFLKKITEDNVKLAKMMIDSTIHVPKDITSLTELVSALKAEVSFTVFKNTSKRKLQVLKYKSENIGGDTSKFIEIFRKLCRDAEIDDLKEQKEYFVETLPYALRKKFLDIIDDIESLSDLILRFNKLLIGPTLSTNIKNGSVVALKHVYTGKYLSTIENLRYKTGSGSQMVYLGGSELDRSSLWIIKFDKDFATTDTYINLQQRFGKFDKFLGMRYYYEYSDRKYYYSSPSDHLEVSCNIMKKNYSDNDWRFDFCDLNNQGYLKPNDIITLSTKNEILNDRYEYLRGHDYQVTIGDEIYYEVICHDKVIGANDNWCIELIEEP